MNRKIYETPTIKVVKSQPRNHILAGSERGRAGMQNYGWHYENEGKTGMQNYGWQDDNEGSGMRNYRWHDEGEE